MKTEENYYSDYGSGSSSNSSTTWPPQDVWTYKTSPIERPAEKKSASYQDYTFGGMGPASVYLRQKSWPEPERSPAPRLPRPRSEWLPSLTAEEFFPKEFQPKEVHPREFHPREFQPEAFFNSTPVEVSAQRCGKRVVAGDRAQA
ncbi:unnamed protein product [Spodoptera littoralis]|uniref:Uncharacterized protein n=1 Tax=Spodoptera littoralis TaxID=7109 RepID=A0A9P0N5F9_SPOLI|nr:unnamed protein product [Spodoptera littoralis]